jgi:N-acetylneuraminic acid mutarotase
MLDRRGVSSQFIREEYQMFRPLPFYPMLTLSMLVLAACGETTTPTAPETDGNPALPDLSLAALANSWTPKAPPPYGPDFFGYDLGMAPNSAGQSIAYAFGGCDPEGAFGGQCAGHSVQAYNVDTDTWSGRQSQVGVFFSNGIGKIGSRLYFSGGYNTAGSTPDASNLLWAYDYTNDRMIKKANLPIFSAEGVSGVIDGKLYVLPGACNGNAYPNPGYCAVEETRRFFRYDPVTNSWTRRRQAPHFHRRGAAAVIDGKFYVAGGRGEVTDLDVYDPATNTWRTLAPLPVGGVASGSALGGQFYVVVQRFNDGDHDHRLFAYNRMTNQWKARAGPPFFGSTTRVTLEGRVHLFTATGNKSALYTR